MELIINLQYTSLLMIVLMVCCSWIGNFLDVRGSVFTAIGLGFIISVIALFITTGLRIWL